MASHGTIVMKQPIAGVVPAGVAEVTVMTVWPSIAVYAPARFLGRLFSIRWPDVYIFRLGHLIALMCIPIALALYFLRLAPWFGIRYKVSNRRIIVQRGIMSVDARSIALDRFNTVEIVVQPGQAWHMAGDLVFRLDNVETFRLEGVSRPESFRQICLKSQLAHTGVKKALQRAKG
jgi:hypothetical protein